MQRQPLAVTMTILSDTSFEEYELPDDGGIDNYFISNSVPEVIDTSHTTPCMDLETIKITSKIGPNENVGEIGASGSEEGIPSPSDNVDDPTCCRKVLDTIVKCCLNWCVALWRKFKTLFNVLKALLSLSVHVFDLSTDLYTTYRHIENGDYVWASLTIAFTASPMVLSSIVGIIFNIGMGNNLLMLAMFVGCPFVPTSILTLALIRAVHSYPNQDTTTEIVVFMKLANAMFESYPQASLQTYIVSTADDHTSIETWQWFTIATSIISLCYALTSALGAMTDRVNNEIAPPATSSKVAWFFSGLLTVTSRLSVSAVFAMACKSMWLIPLGALFVTAIITWSVLMWCPCSNWVPLHKYTHGFPRGMLYAPSTWLITTAFNGITIPGLIVSTVTLVMAGVAWLLSGPTQSVRIMALVLAATSWVINVLLATLPSCKKVRDDYKRIDNHGYSIFY